MKDQVLIKFTNGEELIVDAVSVDEKMRGLEDDTYIYDADKNVFIISLPHGNMILPGVNILYICMYEDVLDKEED